VEALERHGAAVLDDEETERFMAAVFDSETNDLLLQFVGRDAGLIAQAAGVERPGVKLLVFQADAGDPHGAAAHERLAPVVSFFTVDGDEQAIWLCKQLLAGDGAGHTAVVHTSDSERIERFAFEMPTSRVLANVPAAHGCAGVATGLLPTWTLGCGTWGGNSTTDNVGHHNLRNVKRLAEPVAG
jgi:acetaldehyde dehydrogenase/alcohol dehydrogenase